MVERMRHRLVQPMKLPLRLRSRDPALGKGVLAWSPSRLGALRLAEWDADRAEQLSLESGAVASWAETVAGLAPAQATAANRPLYDSDGWSDGSAVINFDGVSDELAIESQPFPDGAEPVEIWGIVRQDRVNNGVSAITRWFGYGGTTNNTSRQGRLSASTTVDNAQGSAGTGAADVVATGPSVNDAGGFFGEHLVRIIVDGTSLRVDRNGLIGAPSACIPGTGSTRVKIGAAMTSAGFWRGGLKYIMVSGLLTGDDEVAMWRYALKRWAGAANVPLLIFMNGDSYSVLQNGDGVVKRLRDAGRKAGSAGVGGTTLAQAVTRAQAMPWMRDSVQIIWDGSCNGYGSLAEDMAKYATLASLCPKTIIIPPVRRYGDDAGQIAATSALQAAIATTYAGRTFDAQAVLAASATSPGDDADVAAGVVPRSLLIDYISNAHLNTAGIDAIMPAMNGVLSANSW